jgi:DNA-binding IclR family transcriptional regulator
VSRAIAILKSFTHEKPERGVGELSRELGLHKSTVSRLMITLERGGLLHRNRETRRYRLGIGLIGLAAQVVSYLDVREVASPVLRQLSKACQESVNLVILDPPVEGSGPTGQVVNLVQFVPPKRQVKNIGRVGRRLCAHCTAAGKVLLAFLPETVLQQTLPSSLERFTPHTITNADRLRQELEMVREQGYAVAREELEEGLNAIASPIYDHSGQVIAAASVSGPAYRVTPESLPHLTIQLVAATSQISAQLGYDGASPYDKTY